MAAFASIATVSTPRGYRVAPADLADKQTSMQRSTGPTSELLPSPTGESPLSASFSFNSYQDILCCSSTGSAFSAADIHRSLARGRQANNSRLGSQANLTSTFGSSKSRAHSRHKSIGRLNELSPESPVAEPHSLGVIDETRQPAQLQQQQQQQPKCQRKQQSYSQVHLKEPEQVGPEPEGEEMSQTMQSIHSLSMQLNQAAGLSDLASDGAPQSAPAASPSGTSKLSKLVGKKALRAKELLLQNLGKADKTTDELFQLYEDNFYKQQSQAVRLQKEFKNHVASLRGAHETSRSLNRCIQQSTGDYQSARHDLVCENLTQLEHLNEDLLEKLRGQVLASISEYLSQFNELREKIAKRRRKLIDYDSSRRVYEIMLSSVNKKRLQIQQQQQQQGSASQGARSFRSAFTLNSQRGDSIQSATSQLVDEARLLKLREQYNYCKIMYETINGELYEELPMLYEKKMKHLLMSLQNYFSIESQFHSNAGKLFATASDVIEELPMSIHPPCSSGRHPVGGSLANHQTDAADEFNKTASGSSGMGSSRGDSSLESSSSLDNSTNGSPVGGRHPAQEEEEDEEEVAVDASQQVVDADHADSAQVAVSDAQSEESGKEVAPGSASDRAGSQPVELQPGTSSEACAPVLPRESPAPPAAESADVAPSGEEKGAPEAKAEETLKSQAKEQSPAKLTEQRMHRSAQGSEHKCLYKVKTSYKYLAEDVDELCFEADEILQVIEFDDSQEQEEGWLMGLREVNGQKGLFPANFTRPI